MVLKVWPVVWCQFKICLMPIYIELSMEIESKC